MIRIRGQKATDWKGLYAIRVATPNALPYIRPDWVRDELARPADQCWPLVAIEESAGGERLVARSNLDLGGGRRGHSARLTLERHPDSDGRACLQLLQETIDVAQGWWNRRRLETRIPATDADAIKLFESFNFVQEARLRKAIKIAGEFIDELVLARLSGDAARPRQPSPPMDTAPPTRPDRRVKALIRGGSTEDWEAYHTIWSQPSVYWGTMQIPHPSADWNRERVLHRAPPRFWPLVAEVEGQVVANAGLHREEHHRSHSGGMGMMVHQDFQGMGVGSALMEALIDLGENWLNLTRLHLEVYSDNPRAIGLYEKYGFEKEGLYHAHSFRAGHYVDTLVMGRVRG
jgi:putative acetyltransferase